MRTNLQENQRAIFPMEGSPREGGVFEILAITAGEGNGWIFSPEVLMEAVALFDQAQCFLDHVPEDSPDGHSARDLAGILTEPVWDETAQGIRATLVPFGPAKEIMAGLAMDILANEGLDARVGFSADLEFMNDGANVTRILKIFSVDMVIDPARGGAVLRALNSVQRRIGADRSARRMKAQLSDNQRATASLAATQSQLRALQSDVAQSRRLRAEMCKNLLETTLSGCNLPLPLRERVRKQFNGRVFEPEELNDAIEDGRALTLALTGGGQNVAGISGRISGMYNSQDQMSAAIHDLLGAKRPDKLRAVQAQRLSGIRELYTLMTGDYEFHGGYDGRRAQFSSTADIPGILKNALNKLVAQRWDELGSSGYRWWEPVVTVEHFENLQDITGILVGEVSLMPSVSEGAPYGELQIADSAEVGAWKKYGGYLGLTLEMFERDDTMKLRQFPFRLATAGLRRISALVSSIFTAENGVGPLMADGHRVFDAVNHRNLGTDALSPQAWEAACAAIYNQSMLTGGAANAPKLAVDGRYLITPRALRLTAQRILYPTMAYEQNIASENMQRGQFGDVATCPDFTDPNDWAVVADPAIAPAIFIGERFGLMPEIYIADNQLTGALFTHDEVRVKARHLLSVFVADYRPLFKSNVV